MATDDHDTKPSTPNAKKSSGTWTLNLGSAICGRTSCGMRRDAHRIDERGVAHECAPSGCERFVIGGAEPPDYSTLADTDPAPETPR